MPRDEPPDEALPNVPVIPAPPEDDVDDAAAREAADINAGRLSLCVRGSTRSMEAYTITATELKGLTIWSVLENRSYTVASGSASFAVGLLLQAIFSGFNNLTPVAQAICFIGAPFGVIIAIISFLIGRYLSSQKDNLEQSIKNETAHDNA